MRWFCGLGGGWGSEGVNFAVGGGGLGDLAVVGWVGVVESHG